MKYDRLLASLRRGSQSVPPIVVTLGVTVVVVLSVALTAAALVGRVGTHRETANAAAARQQGGVPGGRLVTFTDRPDGGIVVADVRSGAVIKTIAPETNHFIRTIMRSLVRERRTLGFTDAAPFALSRQPDDGRLELTDLATGRRIELNAFGPTNFSAFAELLDGVTVRAGTVAKTE